MTQLSGFRSPILFLKATQKKLIYIPPYTKGDGTVVPGHQAYVHVADDHDDAKVKAGQGTYTQKQAHAKHAHEPWFQALPAEHQAPVLMHIATGLQDAASAAAVVSTFKKKIVSGVKPTPGEWKAYAAAPEAKKAEVKAAAEAAGHGALLAQNPEAVVPAAAPAPVEKPAPAVEVHSSSHHATPAGFDALYAVAHAHGAKNTADELECHDSVAAIVAALKSGKVAAPAGASVYALQFDENKIKAFDAAFNAEAKPDVQSTGAKNLFADIADQSIVGHSMLKVGAHYVDPHLQSTGASQEDIDKVGAFFTGVFADAGIPPTPVTAAGAAQPLSAMDKQLVDSMVAKDDAEMLQSLIDKSKKPATVAYAKEALAKLAAADAPAVALPSFPGAASKWTKKAHEFLSAAAKPGADLSKLKTQIAHLKAQKAAGMVNFGGQTILLNFAHNQGLGSIDTYNEFSDFVDKLAGAGKAPAAATPAAAAVESNPAKAWFGFADKHFGDIQEFDDIKPFLGTPEAGLAALQAFSSGAFSELNADPTTPEAKALLGAVAALPAVKVPVIHRVVAFDTDADRLSFLDSLNDPQQRTLSSWTQQDPTAPGQTPANNIGLDLAAQYGDKRVFMSVVKPATAKDISFVYSSKESGVKPGLEQVLTHGTQFIVDSVTNKNGDVHVAMREAQEGDTKPGANGGTLVLKDGHWVKQGGDAPAAPVAAAAPAAATDKLPLLAKISGAKLPSENSNAAGFNPKIQAIADAFKAGDVNKLLHMGFGSNTYQKKAVGLVNEALAALGSPHKVEVSQKMGAHAALNGGTAAPSTPTVGAVKDAPPKVVAAAVKPAAASSLKGKPAYDHVAHGNMESAAGGVKAAHDWLAANPDGKAELKEALSDHGLYHVALQMGLGDAPAPTGKKLTEAQLPPMPGFPTSLQNTWAMQAKAAALNGDVEGVKAVLAKGTGIKFEGYVESLLAAMNGSAPAAAAPAATKPVKVKADHYENTEDGHNKFWNVGVHGNQMITHYGAIGSKGSKTVKTFPSEVAAKVEMHKLIKQKTAKDYEWHGATTIDHDAPVAGGAAPAAAPAAPAAPKAAAPAGPKEGDTKQGADGMLVLKNGHWVKVAPTITASDLPAAPMLNMAVNKAMAEHAKKLALAGDLQGLKILKNNGTNVAKLQVYYGALIAALEKKGVTVGMAAAAQVAPKRSPKVTGAKPTPTPTTAVSGEPVSMIDWQKTAGQKGYNEGGFFKDPAGQDWYCKFPAGGDAVVKNELLANKLAQLAGLSVPDLQLVKQPGGKVGLASKIIPGAKENKAALLDGKASGLLSSFAVHAWLANWDAVGNNPSKGFDNILVDDKGVAHHIDQGGALNYGGAGGKKGIFGDKVIELKTMLDPNKNANTAAVFGKMGAADITASVAKVAAISDDEITDYCLKFGPGSLAEKKAMAVTLIARKNDMIAQYPAAAKAPKAAKPKAADHSWVKLKPGEKVVEVGTKFGGSFAKIEVPAKGFNADGIPKPFTYDKSSSAFVNAANTADIKKVYDTALSSKDAETVKGVKFEQIVKGTGEKTGKMISIDDHPSTAYVKEYVNQVAAELEAQTKPTYRMEHRGGFTSSYSAAAAEIAGAVKALDHTKFQGWKDKAADYLVLNKTAGAGIPAPDMGQFKDVEPSDKEMVAFKAASDAKYAQLSAGEKSACKAYTGSAYWNWNSAMRLGTVDSADFKAGAPMRQAFSKAAVELPEGIVLHRGIGVGGDTYKSVIGAVIQDGSFQSCSYGKKAAFSGHQSQLRLHISKGVKGMMATTFSGFGSSEREIILHPNCRYVVMSVESQGGKNIVNILVLPHEG